MQIIDLSVTISHGMTVFPGDPEYQAKFILLCGDDAARLGKTLACETGPEDAQTMLDFIEAVDSEGLAINYDPANFIIYGFEWFEGVEIFGDLIDHTHAKDARRNADGSAKETPIGEGDIDFARWIDALRGVGFDGWLCIERESGDDRLGDIERGMQYLRKLI